jgi:hypothetical protein
VTTASSLPFADAPRFARIANSTRLMRLVLAAFLIAAMAGAFLVARPPERQPTPLLPPGSNGVIVLDLSASIEYGILDRIYAALTQLGSTRDRFGLIVFSNQAYEALPPETPATQLVPIAAFFHGTPTHAPSPAAGRFFGRSRFSYPANPWTVAFSSGTRISTGLKLARAVLARTADRRRSVWLVSDLADDSKDRAAVVAATRNLIRAGMTLHIVAVHPTAANRVFFARLLGPHGTILDVKPSGQVRLRSSRVFPLALVTISALLVLGLALNEVLSSPLRWRTAV